MLRHSIKVLFDCTSNNVKIGERRGWKIGLAVKGHEERFVPLICEL